MHMGLSYTVPKSACLRRDHVTDMCGLAQGAVGLATSPVIANSFAGLATSATAFAAIEVHHADKWWICHPYFTFTSVVESLQAMAVLFLVCRFHGALSARCDSVCMEQPECR